MSDFIENVPRLIFLKIWEALEVPEKSNLVLAYPELAETTPRVGKHFHCVLCLMSIIYDNFSFDDGQILPKTFAYTGGPDIIFNMIYALQTWKLRAFYKPSDVEIPDKIFTCVLSQFNRTFSFENFDEIISHVREEHSYVFLLRHSLRILLNTNFINNRRIITTPSFTDQKRFADFYLEKMKFFSENTISWKPIYLKDECLPCSPALRCLAHFLREALADDVSNNHGGKTSKYITCFLFN